MHLSAYEIDSTQLNRPELLWINISCNYSSSGMGRHPSPDSEALLAERAVQIAEQIRSARAALNISRKEFEQRYHVGRNTLAKIESDEGHPAMSDDTKGKLEAAFGWDGGQIDRWLHYGIPATGEPPTPVIIDTTALLELAHVIGLAKKFADLPQSFASALESLVDELLARTG